MTAGVCLFVCLSCLFAKEFIWILMKFSGYGDREPRKNSLNSSQPRAAFIVEYMLLNWVGDLW